MWVVEGESINVGLMLFEVPLLFKLVISAVFSWLPKATFNEASGPRSKKFVFASTDSARWGEWVFVQEREYSRKLISLSSTAASSSSSSSARSPSLGLRAYWKPVGLVDSAF